MLIPVLLQRVVALARDSDPNIGLPSKHVPHDKLEVKYSFLPEGEKIT
jgi:hypothetical protein